MSKRISEMSYEEKYEEFKKGVIELLKLNFNGKVHPLEPIVFLGVKQEVLEHFMKEKLNSECDCESCKANKEMMMSINPEDTKDKIHILPIMISNELEFGIKMSAVFGEMAVDSAKEIIDKKVHGVIEQLNKITYNAVQYSAHISEAYLVEHKFTEKDQALQNMGMPNALDDIEKQLKESGGVKNHPESKEKAIIVLETLHFSELVTFDMLRSEGSDYQELINEYCHSHADTPQTGRYLTGLIHKTKIVN